MNHHAFPGGASSPSRASGTDHATAGAVTPTTAPPTTLYETRHAFRGETELWRVVERGGRVVADNVPEWDLAKRIELLLEISAGASLGALATVAGHRNGAALEAVAQIARGGR